MSKDSTQEAHSNGITVQVLAIRIFFTLYLAARALSLRPGEGSGSRTELSEYLSCFSELVPRLLAREGPRSCATELWACNK